jgi:uncharacterized protein
MTHDYSAKAMFWRLLNAGMVLVLLFGLIGIGTMIRYGNAIVPSRTVTVTGEGKTQITPDIATYSFSVVTQGADPEKIQQDNTKKMNSAIAFVKQQGIKDADIKTTGYNLYPRYTYERETGNSRIDGYELNQSVSIKIRDLTSIGKILSGLVSLGVNQAGSLQYSIENPEGQRAAARQQAFANAYEKARQMARQNGVSIARVINFSETNFGGPILYERAYPMMASGKGGDMAPTTEPGSEETTVNVSVTYEIR